MTLAERDRRALQWAGAAVSLFLLLRFAVLPLWDRWQEGRLDLPMRGTALVKYRQALETVGLHRDAAGTLENRLREAEAGLLQSSTPALASAELQEWVKQLTAGAGIEVRSSEFLPVRPQDHGYSQVPLGLQFQCRLDRLVSFLAGLQAGLKIVTVPRLIVQAPGGPGKLVNVNMTVAALMRSE